MSDVEVIF